MQSQSPQPTHAPGARVRIRDEEWLIRRVDPSADGGHLLTCVGISELVPGKRNGYHGRCSPAEALVPLSTYRYSAKAPEGWVAVDEVAPDWWQA
jgi:hypothetical protein